MSYVYGALRSLTVIAGITLSISTTLAVSTSLARADQSAQELETFIQASIGDLRPPAALEAPVRSALLKYYRGLAEKTLKVRTEYSRYGDSEVLDFSQLKDAEQVTRWLPMIQRYLDAAQDSLNHFDSGEKLIAQYLEEEKVPAKDIGAFVAGFKKSAQLRNDGRKLFAVHVQVASNTKKFIEFLIANKAKWTLDPETASPASEDQVFTDQYDSWIERLGQDEELINSYIEKYA